MTHYMEVCEYGWTHGQCRCPDRNKYVKKVECNDMTHTGIAVPYYDRVKKE